MTAKPKKKPESMTDWARVERHQQGLEPIDFSDIPKLDHDWFERAELTYPGQITMKVNVERSVVDWYQKHWPKYRTMMSRVLTNYRKNKIKVLAKEDLITDPVLVVGKFDPDVIKWVKESPDYHARSNQILSDFMQACIEKGEPKPDAAV
jgi:uncharacterized protein (DUF4415 family)